MKHLENLLFKAKDWASPTQTVTGKLVVRDFKTLAAVEENRNENGYIICIENEEGVITIVNPETVELILKPHPDYDFVNEDRVFVNNADGSSSYFILLWSDQTCDWVLIPYTDKTFVTALETDGQVLAEPLIAFGIEALERVEDYDESELD